MLEFGQNIFINNNMFWKAWIVWTLNYAWTHKLNWKIFSLHEYFVPFRGFWESHFKAGTWDSHFKYRGLLIKHSLNRGIIYWECSRNRFLFLFYPKITHVSTHIYRLPAGPVWSTSLFCSVPMMPKIFIVLTPLHQWSRYSPPHYGPSTPSRLTPISSEHLFLSTIYERKEED